MLKILRIMLLSIAQKLMSLRKYATINWHKKLFDSFTRVYFLKLTGSDCTISKSTLCTLAVRYSNNYITYIGDY